MSGERRLTVKEMHPLHFKILESLPKEGEVLGYQRIGKTSKQVTEEVNADLKEGKLTVNQAAGVLKSLQVGEFVTSFRLINIARGIGWQITEQGQKALAERRGS